MPSALPSTLALALCALVLAFPDVQQQHKRTPARHDWSHAPHPHLPEPHLPHSPPPPPGLTPRCQSAILEQRNLPRKSLAVETAGQDADRLQHHTGVRQPHLRLPAHDHARCPLGPSGDSRVRPSRHRRRGRGRRRLVFRASLRLAASATGPAQVAARRCDRGCERTLNRRPPPPLLPSRGRTTSTSSLQRRRHASGGR